MERENVLLLHGGHRPPLQGEVQARTRKREGVVSKVAVDRRATVLGDDRWRRKTPFLREGNRRPAVDGYLQMALGLLPKGKRRS